MAKNFKLSISIVNKFKDVYTGPHCKNIEWSLPGCFAEPFDVLVDDPLLVPSFVLFGLQPLWTIAIN